MYEISTKIEKIGHKSTISHSSEKIVNFRIIVADFVIRGNRG